MEYQVVGNDAKRSRTVAIIGGGAIGAVFGAALANAGIGVTVVDIDPALTHLISTSGVTIRRAGVESSVVMTATTEPAGHSSVDAVFFFVKCLHTSSAAELARPLVGDRTAVVTLQNGWGNAEMLAAVYGTTNLVIGVTYTSATVTERGVVSTSGPGKTFVGSYEAAGADSAEMVAELLGVAGFEIELPGRIRDEIWKKLVLNAATLPTAALTGLTAGALGQSGPMLDLVTAAAIEAVKVGQSHGFEVDADERTRTIEEVLSHAGDGRGSMLQDVAAGRRTEIDVINGAVVRMAKESGVAVPVNEALYALMIGLEKARGQR